MSKELLVDEAKHFEKAWRDNGVAYISLKLTATDLRGVRLYKKFSYLSDEAPNFVKDNEDD